MTGAAAQAHVIVACNAYKQETVILERSALRAGYSFRAVGVGEPWRGLGMKLALYDRALRELVGGGAIGPDDPVMLLDAWDTLVLGPAAELRGKLAAAGALGSGDRVICAADRICAPEYKLAPQMERLFPSVRTPWRYPNSGGFAGTGAALAAFMERLVHGLDGGPYSESGDDQLRVQTFLLDCAKKHRPYPLVLDEDCRFFLCMGEPRCNWSFEPLPRGLDVHQRARRGVDDAAPRLRSLTTGERPLVAHGCGGHGRWFLADVYRELGLLDFLGLEARDLAAYGFAGLVAPGERVAQEHWVNQAPWDFPFQMFQVIRMQALEMEAAGLAATQPGHCEEGGPEEGAGGDVWDKVN